MTMIRSSLIALAAGIVLAADSEGANAGESTAVPNAVLEPLFDETKVKAIKAEMKDREVYPDLATALAKLESAAGKTETFYGLPIGIKGAQDDGTVDESIYEGQRAALGFVGAKKKDATGIKGIVIFPVPTVEQFASVENGPAFIDKVVVKEVALVAFRAFRESQTLHEFLSGVNAAPANAAEYATEAKRGLDRDTFDALWLGFKSTLKEQMPALHDLLPPKAMFLDALRSKNYAESQDDTKALEAKGWFVRFGKAMIKAAEANKGENGEALPLDASAIENWLLTRDELVLERDGGKPKDFSVLDSLGDKLAF